MTTTKVCTYCQVKYIVGYSLAKGFEQGLWVQIQDCEAYEHYHRWFCCGNCLLDWIKEHLPLYPSLGLSLGESPTFDIKTTTG